MEKNSVQFMFLKKILLEFQWNFFNINNSTSFQWNLIFSSGIGVEFLCPLKSSGIPLGIFYGVRFEFLYVHDLGPRSSNDIDLQYSHTFMKSISCLYLPTFRSQASIVSEKSTVFTFSYRWSISIGVPLYLHTDGDGSHRRMCRNLN